MSQHAPTELPRLGRYLRNLAYAQPIVRLDLERNVIGPGGLFNGMDLAYAAMALIVFLMEKRTIDLGAQRPEILDHMARVLTGMRPDVPAADARMGGELVLEALSNRTGGHQSFRATCWEPEIGFVPHEFRLVDITPTDDGRILYTATDEAIFLHLAMLEVDPAVAQKAEELMLEYLVRNNRIRESVNLAERARTRSLQYQQFIRRKIFQAQRAPESVRWSREVVPELQAAGQHVLDRQRQERTILDAVAENRNHATASTLPALLELQRLVEDCQTRHSALHREILAATDTFLALQVDAFRPRHGLAHHHLEGETLTELLRLPISSLAHAADTIATLLTVPRIERLLSLPWLFKELAAAEPEGAAFGDDAEAAEPLPIRQDDFPAAMIDDVQSYLMALFQRHPRLDVEDALRQARLDGLSPRRRRCAAFLMLQAYHPEGNPFGTEVEVDGRFAFDVARGARLVFVRPAGSSEAIEPEAERA